MQKTMLDFTEQILFDAVFTVPDDYPLEQIAQEKGWKSFRSERGGRYGICLNRASDTGLLYELCPAGTVVRSY